MRQQFVLCQEQLQSDIEDAVGMDEAVGKIVSRSESMEAEISGVLFFDPRNEEVTDVFVDSVGSLTEVDLSLVRIPSDPDLQTFSFHTHPRFGILDFSQADVQVAGARSWEQGHCVLSRLDGDRLGVNCLEF